MPPFSLAGFKSAFASKPKKSKKLGPKRKDVATAHGKADPKKPTFTVVHRAIAAAAFSALWVVAHPLFRNPVLPHPLTQPYSHPTQPLKILSAVDSVTGLITVAEWLPPPTKQAKEDILHSARYLRASHSILGGVWTNDKVVAMPGERPFNDSFGTPLGDSIYSAFTLQEAARLVDSTPKGKTGKWETALVMYVPSHARV